MEKECPDGCDWDDAGEVCEDNDSYLAEGPDFEFLTNFAKLLKLDVNWRIGITYNHSTDIFVRESDGKEVDLSNVYKKQESRQESVENKVEEERPWFYADIDFKYEYDYHEELHDMSDHVHDNADDHHHEVSCLELSSINGWKVAEGRCHRRKSKDLNIQPLCQL